MAGFVWGGNTGEKMTPQEVDRKRLAAALMAKQAGDTSPVASPFAGINRALQGYLSGRDDKRAGAAEAAGMAQGQAAMNPVLEALSGGGQASGGGGGYAPAPTDATGLIRDFEGFRETPYWDVNALRAGYGSDTVTMADGSVVPVGKGTRVSREDADRDLARRVGTEFIPRAQAAVGADVWGGLDPSQQSALASITYNYGSLPGSVAKAVQTPGTEDDIAAIRGLASHNDGVNAKRRNREADIYAGGGMGGQTTASTMGAPSGNSDILGLLMQAQADPWAAQQYGPVLDALMGSELQTRQQQSDPMYQLGLQKSQLELQQMQNPGAPAPIEVGGVLLDPVTYQPIFDSRTQEAPKAGFRMASPDEAKAYGAGAGQFGPDGRFYAADVPQGMTIESDGAGGFRMVQGPAGADKPFTEAQGKDVVFATRAQGALDALDPVAGELTNRAARAAEYDPTGLARGAMQSDNFQIAKNAGDEFLQALLRKDSGAAITEGEMALYGSTYLPKPGDNPKLIEQKKAARARAVAAIKAGMSPAQIVAQEKALGVTPVDGGATDTPPPAGVDAETWGHMTPEEKALFQ